MYRSLVSVAEMIADREENIKLEQKFKELKFDNEDMLELENQLADMVDFFRKNHLVDYYR